MIVYKLDWYQGDTTIAHASTVVKDLTTLRLHLFARHHNIAEKGVPALESGEHPHRGWDKKIEAAALDIPNCSALAEELGKAHLVHIVRGDFSQSANDLHRAFRTNATPPLVVEPEFVISDKAHSVAARYHWKRSLNPVVRPA